MYILGISRRSQIGGLALTASFSSCVGVLTIKAWPPNDKQQYAEGTLSPLCNGNLVRPMPYQSTEDVQVQSGSPCAVQHPMKHHDGAIIGLCGSAIVADLGFGA